jgi:hypothetical protein
MLDGAGERVPLDILNKGKKLLTLQIDGKNSICLALRGEKTSCSSKER